MYHEDCFLGSLCGQLCEILYISSAQNFDVTNDVKMGSKKGNPNNLNQAKRFQDKKSCESIRESQTNLAITLESLANNHDGSGLLAFLPIAACMLLAECITDDQVCKGSSVAEGLRLGEEKLSFLLKRIPFFLLKL